ncbi:hypothetical protein FZEAL_3110 [Fusarium zealandicum]|uniref:Uncharacterized protein n=1 Tax=Fusarium zealandicum TaxID=1053134 RepID=A0A8H4UPF4_9HYPO|nr:hypothetical protein FZEAL_3110 [Fusarium zealandicum]
MEKSFLLTPLPTIDCISALFLFQLPSTYNICIIPNQLPLAIFPLLLHTTIPGFILCLRPVSTPFGSYAPLFCRATKHSLTFRIPLTRRTLNTTIVPSPSAPRPNGANTTLPTTSPSTSPSVMLEPQAMRGPIDQTVGYGHSRTRTTSSNTFPMQFQTQHLAHPGQNSQQTRRSPSVNTFSTASSIPPPAAYRTSSTTELRRSTSSRSGGSPQPGGYVALLRKQKGTVWCDRAQYEDPRILAQQRAAKMRATLEVVGGARGTGSRGTGGAGGRTSTGLSTTTKVAAKIPKIRHHGKTPLVGYAPGENHVGVGGVPMRLSATEVEAESSDEEEASRPHHRRTGSSGRSSTASGRRTLGYRSSGGMGSQKGNRWSPGDTPERTGSLVKAKYEDMIDDAASGKALSTGSGSSGERADNLGELGNAPKLASNSLMHSALTREKSVKSPDELRRRGSVDERTSTLTSGRLFIANPD